MNNTEPKPKYELPDLTPKVKAKAPKAKAKAPKAKTPKKKA